jgi:hypothetical protein
MLNKVGEVRPAQLVTTFGPGAILDAVHDSVTVLDINYWKNTGARINDSRLARYLDVDYFLSPRVSYSNDLPVISFPNYHICLKDDCNRLFDINENFDLEKYLKHGPTCPNPKCGWKAYPARFIISCMDGHLDDFPWRWWVHNGESSCTRVMRFESTGNTSSLGELLVKCDCGVSRTMAGATQEENFKGYKCTGRHPQRPSIPKKNDGRYKDCKCSVIPMQRGASNVYFPVIRSAISIPPWTNPIHDLVHEHYTLIKEYKEDFGEVGLLKIYDKYFKERYTRQAFDDALKNREEKINEYIELKEMEYAAITHHNESRYNKSQEYFKASEEKVPNYLKNYFSRIIKIERLREVMVLLGFMRIDSPEPEIDNPPRIVNLKSDKKDKWLPAVKIHGEGIFIELNKESIDSWSNDSIPINRLSKKYKSKYKEYIKTRGWSHAKDKDAVYVLLHTLSHVLIKELSMQCGYSSASIKERIYYSEEMRGILLYTGSSDKEGSLGGLVEMGRIEKFTTILVDALKNAITCTTDPKCMTQEPDDDTINGAACHSCAMISETSCETGNRLLDRSLLISLPNRINKGYFDELVKSKCGIMI